MVMLVQPAGMAWRFSKGEETATPMRRKRATSFMLCHIVEPFVLWSVVVSCTMVRSNENIPFDLNFCKEYHHVNQKAFK